MSNTYQIISKEPTGRISEAGPMPMGEALKQARQLRAGGHVDVIMRCAETNTDTPIDEFDELD